MNAQRTRQNDTQAPNKAIGYVSRPAPHQAVRQSPIVVKAIADLQALLKARGVAPRRDGV